jgi:YaiO family outer membrane protein
MMRSIIVLASLLFGAIPAQAQPDVATLMAQGREARIKADFVAAEVAYGSATQAVPTNAEAWHMLGLVQSFQGKHDIALNALTRALALAPQDADIALSQARVTAFTGRYDQADKLVDALLVRAPSMAAWTLKGRIASYQSKFSAAQTAYDQAARLGTPDVDLLVAYGDLARAQGQEDKAMAYFRQAEALDATSVDVRNRLTLPQSEQATPWQLALSGGKSWLSRTPALDWTSADMTLSREVAPRVRAFGGVSYAKRFSLSDVMLRGGFNATSGRGTIAVDVGFTPSDNVLPEFQSFVTGSYRLTDEKAAATTVAVLDAQLRRYSIGTVKTLSPGIDQYVLDGKLTISARLANTWDTNDKHLLGWSASALWQATDRVGLRVGYGDAPEAERGLVADTKTMSTSVIVRLTETTSWRIDLAREQREGGYRRVEATTGVSLTF